MGFEFWGFGVGVGVDFLEGCQNTIAGTLNLNGSFTTRLLIYYY